MRLLVKETPQGVGSNKGQTQNRWKDGVAGVELGRPTEHVVGAR